MAASLWIALRLLLCLVVVGSESLDRRTVRVLALDAGVVAQAVCR